VPGVTVRVVGFSVEEAFWPLVETAGYVRGYVAPSGVPGFDFTPQADITSTTAQAAAIRPNFCSIKLIQLSYLHTSVIANVLSHQQSARALGRALYRQSSGGLRQNYRRLTHRIYQP
jgi:hypothetical protein